ncbi:diguanylate cyclase [Niallia oryzisoli]|uniref:Diguanylate cyclase n=1 Tax=Niallia oryzisoli TaxID=1737571 RepID=A0ABZ2CEW1_9BACI
MGFFNRLSNLIRTKYTTFKQQLDIGKNPLFSQLPDAVFIINTESHILSMNHQAKTLLGYTPEDRKNFLAKWMPNDMVDILKSNIHLTRNGESPTFNAVLLHKTGQKIPILFTLIPNGNDCIYCVCKDLRTINDYKNRISSLYDNLLYLQKITNIGSFDYDVALDTSFWSNQTYEIFGVDDCEFVPTWETIVQLIHPNDKKKYEETIQNSIDYGHDYELEHRIVRSNGEDRIAFQRGEAVKDETGKTVRLIGTVQDITEQKNLELKLIENEKQMKSVTDRLHVGIWSYDVRQNRYTLCSKGIEEMYGVAQQEFLEKNTTWFKYIHQEDLFYVLADFKRSMNGDEMTFKHRIIDANGNVKWLHHQVLPYQDADGTVIRLDGIIGDITKEKEQQDTLTFNANHDYLTKLPNRRYFEKELAETLHQSLNGLEMVAVFYLDLDRFKLINDTLGHEIGDKLLINVAKRLNHVLGDHTFLARLGGDEFAVCVKQFEEKDEVIRIAESIIQAMKEPFDLDGELVKTATSIGISFFPDDGLESLMLLKRADHALYKAKEAGRGKWMFYS